jgi:protein kinase-like protein
MDDEQTRLSGAAAGSAVTSDTGWLTSSGSIDHGRFAPGTILDNRYRILGLLGRGGMGEVYRADDLRLGQPVALKFLPSMLSRDPVRLAQFHNEVRTARQVSHANVCRVYDIGEIDGQLFITMEYVDGEDLSSLLRRIGRLPEDKGLEIARQICAGLAAAHERGVLHRDLKPANIMLDGSGRVRLMDFSLAAVGDVQDIRAGTPAYMAPEQLAGQEVTQRSDIYALGLVLYEIFTGRRAFDAKNLSELIEQHQSGALILPTMLVKSLDPAIEAAIVRCLERDPARRPASAIRVSAALPGGDPLAAALAAGETPSPEMVAAVGGDEAMLSVVSAGALLAATVALVLAFAFLTGRYAMLSRIPLTKPALVLADRAEELRQSFGFPEPADSVWWFSYDEGYLSWAAKNGSGKTRWAELPSGRPAAVRFWYRTSPRPLVPFNGTNEVNSADPPLLMNGMTNVLLDTKGRLLRFESAPPQVETAAPPAAAPVDWGKLFSAAGLDYSAFKETTPSRTPQGYADSRRAWQGTAPDTKTPITVEAASYRGRPVLFEVVGPWTTSSREPGSASRPGSAVFISVLLTLAAWFAYRNVRRGRADMSGAFRLAAVEFFVLEALWLIGRHVPDFPAEQQRFFARTGLAMFVGAALYILYLGLEPFVRRAWPAMLVGWSKLLTGRIRDPLIGRDVLIGVATGATLAFLSIISAVITIKLGLPEPQPRLADFGGVLGPRYLTLTLLVCVNTALQNALISVFTFAVFRAVYELLVSGGVGAMRRRWKRAAEFTLRDRTSEAIFIVVAVVLMTATSMSYSGPAVQRVAETALQATAAALMVVVLLRAGILAAAVVFFVQFVLERVPLTLDSHALFASAAWFTMAAVVGLAAAGAWLAARAGTPRPSV